MESLERWQYPWIALALFVGGVALVSLSLTGISVVTGFASVVAVGLATIVVRPRLYGYVMAGIGVLSVALSGLLFLWDWSLLTVAVLALVGLGAVARGVHTQQNMDPAT
ncbi:hypothetical protein D8Y22_06360 [Salinadaptatus halalkaliphilus]|uniref:Uncharacterized protein n=1 Tax=Salinadaptatus halalkaliphilus TaxID=2419781 RepID=A0A4S3TR60_9EURY|nr:hypothetical protein [Salinadaptatus halalkaliphilus]THE65785.1 hypothetical protein D8Y22_06360 [Salinadaptatus halalkaliphilus]